MKRVSSVLLMNQGLFISRYSFVFCTVDTEMLNHLINDEEQQSEVQQATVCFEQFIVYCT